MTRGLSAAVKAYTGPIRWTADITAPDGTAIYLWDGERDQAIGGNTYKPYLRITAGFRRTRSLRVDAGEIELDMTDLFVQDTILSKRALVGGTCVIQQYLVGLDQLVEIFRGRLGEQSVRIDAVSYRLVSEPEPSQIQVPAQSYSPLCGWRFGKPECSYDRANITVTEHLAEQAADIFSSATIGKSTLAMVVDAQKDRIAEITAGTGRGQRRRIKSNTATTLTLYGSWKTTPDATSKFRVITAPNGAPKLLFTGTLAFDIATADIFTARTIGRSTLAMTTDEHKSTGPDDDAAVVRLVAGTGSGQERKIKANTGTTITIADEDTAFSPVPDATSQFRVLYLRCTKDVLHACEQRALAHRFNGVPTVSPDLSRLYSEPRPTRGEVSGSGRDRVSDGPMVFL